MIELIWVEWKLRRSQPSQAKQHSSNQFYWFVNLLALLAWWRSARQFHFQWNWVCCSIPSNSFIQLHSASFKSKTFDLICFIEENERLFDFMEQGWFVCLCLSSLCGAALRAPNRAAHSNKRPNQPSAGTAAPINSRSWRGTLRNWWAGLFPWCGKPLKQLHFNWIAHSQRAIQNEMKVCLLRSRS